MIKKYYKQFKKLKGLEKTNISVAIVNNFLNTKQFTKKVNSKTFNIRESAELILISEINDVDLEITYNKVCTMVFNSKKSLDIIKEKVYNRTLQDNICTIQLDDFYIRTSNFDSLKSTNSNDLFWLHKDDEIFLVLKEEHSDNNSVGDVLSNSKLLPLYNKKYDKTKVLNGKDWVKHYLIKPEEGYLYFVKLKISSKEFYKVGISKSINRFKNKVDVLESNFIKMSMLKASLIEQFIHIENKNRRLYVDSIDSKFEGKTECYYNNMTDFYTSIEMDTCIDVVSKYNGYDKNIIKLALKD